MFHYPFNGRRALREDYKRHVHICLYAPLSPQSVSLWFLLPCGAPSEFQLNPFAQRTLLTCLSLFLFLSVFRCLAPSAELCAKSLPFPRGGAKIWTCYVFAKVK